MIRRTFDYEYGTADFICDTADDAQALREFLRMAGQCFGIRKSIGRVVQIDCEIDVRPPGLMASLNATHWLSHHGDEVAFDARVTMSNGDAWKVFNEWENVCTCPDRGVPALACELHEWYAKRAAEAVSEQASGQ